MDTEFFTNDSTLNPSQISSVITKLYIYNDSSNLQRLQKTVSIYIKMILG